MRSRKKCFTKTSNDMKRIFDTIWSICLCLCLVLNHSDFFVLFYSLNFILFFFYVIMSTMQMRWTNKTSIRLSTTFERSKHLYETCSGYTHKSCISFSYFLFSPFFWFFIQSKHLQTNEHENQMIIFTIITSPTLFLLRLVVWISHSLQ